METTEQSYMNAREGWPLFDTVQIGENIRAPLGYPSFRDIPTKIPFFNVRTEGEVGSAMCNLESKDSLAFAYEAYSLGVSFRFPSGIYPSAKEAEGEPIGASNVFIPILWQQEIGKRIAIRLQIRQDDKLLANVNLTPEGTGPHGQTAGLNIGETGGLGYLSNSIVEGQPFLKNRYPFPEPLQLPRGCTFRAILELDDFGRQIMAAWPDMPTWAFAIADDGVEVKVIPRATIRVSIFGRRLVQQRNALHI